MKKKTSAGCFKRSCFIIIYVFITQFICNSIDKHCSFDIFRYLVGSYENAKNGKHPIVMVNVNCSGSEADLSSCPHRGGVFTHCGHSEDVAIGCQELNGNRVQYLHP